MAGLGLFGQKNIIAATTPIVNTIATATNTTKT
jgi:hypothetical protein